MAESPICMINEAETETKQPATVPELAELLDLQDHPAVREMIAKFEAIDPLAYWQAARQAEVDRSDPDPELVRAIDRRIEACQSASATSSDAEPVESNDGLVWWQTEPCPAWCISGHELGDNHDEYTVSHPDDRIHWSDGTKTEIELTMAEPSTLKRSDGRVDDFVPTLDVFLAQGWRETEPHVCMEFNSSTTTELTLAEATALHEQLGAELAKARQGDQGEDVNANARERASAAASLRALGLTPPR